MARQAQESANQESAGAITTSSPLPPFEPPTVRTIADPVVESFEPVTDNRVVPSPAQSQSNPAAIIVPQEEYVQETPILRTAHQIYQQNIEPRTAESLHSTRNPVLNDLMNVLSNIAQNQRATERNILQQTTHMVQDMEQRLGAQIHERAESLRSRATSRRSRARSPARSESSYARRYERGDPSDSEDESIQPTPTRNAPTHRIRSRSPTPIPRNRGLKLEVRLKLLQKFDGSNDLDHFQTLFTKFVLEDTDLNPEAKHAVLMNHITGPAAKCVSHARDPSVAIMMTFSALNKVYGKVNNKHNLLRKLQSLPFHQTDPDAMRLDAASLTNVLQQLKDKGVPADDHMTMWAIACKLPENMQKSLAKYTVKMGECLTHDLILDRISRDIETMAMEQTYVSQRSPPANELTGSYATVNFANATPSRQKSAVQSKGNNPSGTRKPVYDPKLLESEYIDPITKAKLEGIYAPGPKGVNLRVIYRTFPFHEKEETKCKVCRGDHHEIRCTLSSKAFRDMCKTKGLCAICTRKHDITACGSTYRCGYCNGAHHLGGCPQKEFYRDMKNYPKDAPEVATFFRASHPNKSK
ncbi:hypothetical protein GCK72_011151 [Caenorhabditis remanei]|uniref:Uncharacterized protein n=1 Tax=Caenorhabditis remanei TaxID=31234 RepID=A0A6A5H6R9_CAERE|nr:hypothetical protein GCK72_011151 [Caenorhabditis remanei]KAF1762887.1 hypothetical protein GCK72_011151 [Caenorhabditis remanei]